MSILSQKFVFDALEAEKNGEQFPVNFDYVWQLLGYSRKSDAKDRLINTLVENEHYLIANGINRNLTTDSVLANLHPQQKAILMRTEVIKLSLDGFKHFCLLAQTKQGKEVRQYFIDIEKAYRQQLEIQFTASNNHEVEALKLENSQLKERLDFVTKKALMWERKAHQAVLSESIRTGSEEFQFCATRLWVITGIASYSYICRAIEHDYVYGEDYITQGWTSEQRKDAQNYGRKQFLLTGKASISLVLSLRSRAGCSRHEVPEEYHFLFDAMENTKINRRKPQSR